MVPFPSCRRSGIFRQSRRTTSQRSLSRLTTGTGANCRESCWTPTCWTSPIHRPRHCDKSRERLCYFDSSACGRCLRMLDMRGGESRLTAPSRTRSHSWSFPAPPLSLFGEAFESPYQLRFSAPFSVRLVSCLASILRHGISLEVRPSSGQLFSCGEALKDHQAKMKDKSHTCDTWCVLLHAPSKFCLSVKHSGNVYTSAANLKRHVRVKHSN